MVWNIGMHGPYHADIVDLPGDFRENLAHFRARLPGLIEFESCGQAVAGFPFGGQMACGHRFACMLRQHGLGVKCIDLRRTAVHEQVDDVFGFGREMRRLGCQSIASNRCSLHMPGIVHDTGKADHAHSGS